MASKKQGFKLQVGLSKKEFREVQKSLFTRSSDFFKAIFRHQWKETVGGIVHLPEVEEGSFPSTLDGSSLQEL